MTTRNSTYEEENTITINGNEKMHSCALCDTLYDTYNVPVCPNCSCPRDVTKIQLDAIRLVGQWQMSHWEGYPEYSEYFISLNDYDQAIIDPFTSNCSRFEVENPFLEYTGIDPETGENIGVAFADSDFLKLIKPDSSSVTAFELAQGIISQILDNLKAACNRV